MSKRTLGIVMFVFGLSVVAMPRAASAQATWERISENDHRNNVGRLTSPVCGDRWIDYAFSATSGGTERPQSRDCTIGHYNNGNWNSLLELITLVDCYKSAGRQPCSLVEYARRFTSSGGDIVIETLANGNPLGNLRVSQQTGRVTANAGANLIGTGVGSIVAGGGLNLVGQDAASLIGQDGASLIGKGGAGYRLMSSEGTVRRVGRGLYRAGATVRGKDVPKLDMKIGAEMLTLVGTPSGPVPAAPKAPAAK